MRTKENDLIYVYKTTQDGEFGYAYAKNLTRDNMVSGPLRELSVGEKFYPSTSSCIIVAKVSDKERVKKVFGWYKIQSALLYKQWFNKEWKGVARLKSTGSLEVKDNEELEIMMEMMVNEL